ncbi:MAG: hypothetical protein M1817_003095 [Caeruleum heppii]|nr:MAG: hypothetical protein M1817_003095 [Caeruleum heppii]
MTYRPEASAPYAEGLISKQSWSYQVHYPESLEARPNTFLPRGNSTFNYFQQACDYLEWTSEKNGYDEMGVVITRDVKTPVFINMQRLRSNKSRQEGIWPGLFEFCSWGLYQLTYSNVCNGREFEDFLTVSGNYTSAGGTMAARMLLHDAGGVAREDLDGPDMALRISIRADYNVKRFHCDEPYCLYID